MKPFKTGNNFASEQSQDRSFNSSNRKRNLLFLPLKLLNLLYKHQKKNIDKVLKVLLFLVAKVYILFEIYDIRPSATKTDSFLKISHSKKNLVYQCGSGGIHFHWPNLFSLAKSFFSNRIYFVKYMMYVPVRENRFFSEKFLAQKKRLCLSMWDWCRFNEPVRTL